MSPAEARLALAGLVDPERPSGGDAEAMEVKEAAIRLGSILARLFGDELDRTTLWERIGSAVESACSKVDDGDLDRFAHLCLEHVVADAGRAAACDALTATLEMFEVRPVEWRQAFVRYCRTHRIALIVHVRRRWELVKKGAVEL